MRAGTCFLDAFDNDALARIEPLGDHPKVVEAVGGLDVANDDFVIGVDDGHLVASLNFADRTLRNDERSLLSPDDRAHFGVTAGTQNIFGIGEKSGEANRAGAFIDLTIGEEKGALVAIN